MKHSQNGFIHNIIPKTFSKIMSMPLEQNKENHLLQRTIKLSANMRISAGHPYTLQIKVYQGVGPDWCENCFFPLFMLTICNSLKTSVRDVMNDWLDIPYMYIYIPIRGTHARLFPQCGSPGLAWVALVVCCWNDFFASSYFAYTFKKNIA